VDETAAGHAAEPTTGLDHENPPTLARGGDRGGDTGRVASVNAHVGGTVARIGRPRGKQGADGGRAAAVEELTAMHGKNS